MLAPKAPPTLGWLRARPVYGLIPLAGIGGLVLLLGNVEGGPGFMVDLAAVATPVLATAGVFCLRIGWAVARAPVLYVIAWKADEDSRWAQGSADALIIMASGTLAWLTGLIAPRRALVAGILVATAVDVYQVLNEDVQPVSQALTAAQPAAGLPRLQEVVWGTASMGWGDVFLGALLGIVVASSPRLVLWMAAVATFVLHLAWGFMFHVMDTLAGHRARGRRDPDRAGRGAGTLPARSQGGWTMATVQAARDEQLLIGGEWVEAHDGARFDVDEPGDRRGRRHRAERHARPTSSARSTPRRRRWRSGARRRPSSARASCAARPT